MQKILILLMMCMPVVAQSRDSLKKKYGEPISESFLVKSGIIVTATYSPTGEIAELLIAPQTTDIIKSRSKTLAREAVKEILLTLVPLSERGRLTSSAFINLFCLPANDCLGSAEDYEKVTIYFNGSKDGVNYAVVQWRK
ncbi:MAG: hypothetical protein C5B44_05990 [Acidobacteria bacterium]|nr:MAG: hypothetical protein C5B44_05990 [Acidobacteriota bacterium]